MSDQEKMLNRVCRHCGQTSVRCCELGSLESELADLRSFKSSALQLLQSSSAEKDLAAVQTKVAELREKLDFTKKNRDDIVTETTATIVECEKEIKELREQNDRMRKALKQCVAALCHPTDHRLCAAKRDAVLNANLILHPQPPAQSEGVKEEPKA